MADDEKYILETEEKIKNLVNSLGWSFENFAKNKGKDFVNCPNNVNHLIPSEKIEKHLEKCDLMSDGCIKDDVAFPESFPSKNYVMMTPQLQEQIFREAQLSGGLFRIRLLRPVPQSTNRLCRDFTREERLAIYEYVREKTKSGTIPEADLIIPERREEKRELSSMERAILERDARRRRATYRVKVHLNYKSHTEVMREVIASQMVDMVNTSDLKSSSKKSKKKKEKKHHKQRHHKKKKRKREKSYSS